MASHSFSVFAKSPAACVPFVVVVGIQVAHAQELATLRRDPARRVAEAERIDLPTYREPSPSSPYVAELAQWAGSALAPATVSSTANGATSALSSSGSGCSPGWLPTTGERAGTNAYVYAAVEFDDGSGPAWYVAGAFSIAGANDAQRVAKWDGVSWSAVGNGLGNTSLPGQEVWALAVFDDGTGAALYAGGSFADALGAASNIAKWDGTSWTTVSGGTNDTVYALEVFDNGRGNALYAGGAFTMAGATFANRIARWDGASWSALGSGLSDGNPGTFVYALESFDDGSGEQLYVGGLFQTAGGVSARNIVRWSGAIWSPIGTGTNNTVSTLVALDDGGGEALFAGGYFTSANGVLATRIAKWNGVQWSALGSGFNNWVHAISVRDEGGVPTLYAGGEFANSGATTTIKWARWDGTGWFQVSTGASGVVWSLLEHDDGGGSELFVAGEMGGLDHVSVNFVGKWDGAKVTPLCRGWNGPMTTLHVHDDGSGDALYAGGSFTRLGELELNRLARWDGASWTSVGGGVAGPEALVSAFATHDDGSGSALFVAGDFTSAGGVPAENLAKWNGSTWSALGAGLNGVVLALVIFDDGSGPALYAGGGFTKSGTVLMRNVAKWDGASWTPLGSGTISTVHDFQVFDDGSGPALFVAGGFASAGGIPAMGVAKWTASGWSALPGSTLTGSVYVAELFDDGSGLALFAGGALDIAGGVFAENIAKWDGTSWSDVGGGLPEIPYGLGQFDDGSGPALYATGFQGSSGNSPTRRVARWDGSTWTPLAGDFSNSVRAYAAFDDGTGPAFFASGDFAISPTGDSYLARWGCPLPISGRAYCTAGTTSNGCVPSIGGSGVPSASAGVGFDIVVSAVEGQKAGLIFYGVSGPKAAAWGPSSSSYLCVDAPTQRMATQSSGGASGMCDGVLSEDWNAYIASHPSALGQTFAAGETIWAQAWFRDPPAPKTTNLSDALVFTLAP